MDRSDASYRLRWLGAEFAIIVLGVLSALFVDTWMDERQDIEHMAVYRESLIVELESDIANIREQSSYMSRVRDYGLLVLADLEGEAPLTDFALLFAAFNAAEEVGFRPQASTYDDMRSTGSLRLLADMQFRLDLADYYRIAATRERFWLLDPEYRRDVRGIIPSSLQAAIRERCENRDTNPREQLPSGLSSTGSTLLPAFADGSDYCGIELPAVDFAGPAQRIRSDRVLQEALRYRLSQIHVAIAVYEAQSDLAEKLLAGLRTVP